MQHRNSGPEGATVRMHCLLPLAIVLSLFEVVSTFFIHGYKVQPFPHPRVPNCYSLLRNATTPASIHCLPSVLVAGFPKCGTSALYGLLELHPFTIGTRSKEYCIRGSNNLVTYLKGLPGPEDIDGKVLVSGCLFFKTPQQIVRLKPKSLKILLLVREYAERAWAAYNFWCDPQFDVTCATSFDWTTKDHYRSPEMFHEIVLAQDRNISLKLWNPTVLRDAPRYYRDRIQQYTDLVPPQDVHVIHSAQLEASPEVVWKGVSDFLNHSLISSPHPAMEVFRSRRYNTQDNKGEKNFRSSAEYQSQLYPVSGNRSMLPRTREILNEHWRLDCLWLKENYNLTSLEVC